MNLIRRIVALRLFKDTLELRIEAANLVQETALRVRGDRTDILSDCAEEELEANEGIWLYVVFLALFTAFKSKFEVVQGVVENILLLGIVSRRGIR